MFRWEASGGYDMSKKLDPNEEPNATRQSRRDFLERAGRFALYTPPTVLMLMQPGAEALASTVTVVPSEDDQGDNNDDQGDDQQ